MNLTDAVVARRRDGRRDAHNPAALVLLAAVGCGVLGAVLAVAGAQALSGVLFVGVFDPVSFGLAFTTLLAVAALANWIPARRA